MATNRAAEIREKAVEIKAQSQEIDTSNTETVTVADIQVHDVITKLGKVTFPFPFTLSKVQKIGTFGFTMTATHGWFAPLVNATDKVTRVVR